MQNVILYLNGIFDNKSPIEINQFVDSRIEHRTTND